MGTFLIANALASVFANSPWAFGVTVLVLASLVLVGFIWSKKIDAKKEVDLKKLENAQACEENKSDNERLNQVLNARKSVKLTHRTGEHSTEILSNPSDGENQPNDTNAAQVPANIPPPCEPPKRAQPKRSKATRNATPRKKRTPAKKVKKPPGAKKP